MTSPLGIIVMMPAAIHVLLRGMRRPPIRCGRAKTKRSGE
jgi:hypothetical protein